MALSKERTGEITLLLLEDLLEKDGGLRLSSKEIKRKIINAAKKMGIEPFELAEVAKALYQRAFDKTMAEVNTIIANPKKDE